MQPQDLLSSGHVNLQIRFKMEESNIPVLEMLKLEHYYKPEHNNAYVTLGLDKITQQHYLDAELVDLLVASKDLFDQPPMTTILAWESGGYFSDNCHGFGQTVCGFTGKPLKPFYIGETPNGKHAAFCVPSKTVVCVSNIRTDDRINLGVFDVIFDFTDESYNAVSTNVVVHWAGSRFYETSPRYRIPLGLAFAKSRTPNCSGPVYMTSD
jgi:hypothetical protein